MKQFRGSYLAPKVEVAELELQYQLMNVSTKIDVDDNPFGNNTEDEWGTESLYMDWYSA